LDSLDIYWVVVLYLSLSTATSMQRPSRRNTNMEDNSTTLLWQYWCFL